MHSHLHNQIGKICLLKKSYNVVCFALPFSYCATEKTLDLVILDKNSEGGIAVIDHIHPENLLKIDASEPDALRAYSKIIRSLLAGKISKISFVDD